MIKQTMVCKDLRLPDWALKSRSVNQSASGRIEQCTVGYWLGVGEIVNKVQVSLSECLASRLDQEEISSTEAAIRSSTEVHCNKEVQVIIA